MKASEKLLQIMLDEGADISESKQMEVIQDFDRALSDGTFYIIKDNDNVSGFFSYFKEGKRVFVNNLIIFKRYRKTGSLLKARHFIRKAFKDIDQIYWENKRRGDKLCYVK